MTAHVPITVVGGRWGAGKTGVVDRLADHLGPGVVTLCDAHHDHGHPDHRHRGVEVIPIEEELLAEQRGSATCVVRGDLLEAVGDLIDRRTPPRHVVIEAVGGADLALIAQTLLRTSALRDRTRLAGLVAVVDGHAAGTALVATGALGLDDEDLDALAIADLVVINRLDRLVPAVESRTAWDLWGTSGARQTHLDRGPGDRGALAERILGLAGFDPVRASAALPQRSHDHVLVSGPTPRRSVLLEVDGRLDRRRLDDWIGDVQARSGRGLLRWRARFAVRGRRRCWVGVGARTSTLVDDGPEVRAPRSSVHLVGYLPPTAELLDGLRRAVA